MNFFALISALATTSFLLVGGFVLARNVRAELNRVVFFYCVIGALGSGSEFCFRTATSAGEAQFWINLNFSWVLIVPILLHFVLVFTRRRALLRQGSGYLLIYGPPLALIGIFLATDLIELVPVRVAWGWTFVAETSAWLEVVLIGWTAAVALAGVAMSLSYVLGEKGRQRQVGLYVLLAVLVPGLLGFLTEGVRPFDLDLPGLGSFGGFISCILLVVAMWRLDLFAVTAASAAESVLATMSDLVFLLGPDLRIVLANRAAYRTLGYDDGELVGQLMERMIAPDHTGRMLGKRTPGSGVTDPSLDVHVMICGKGGRRVPVSLSTSLLTDEEKRIRGSVVVCRDIGARVEAQQALTESEERFRLLVENSPSIAVQGFNPDRRIFFWNDASERIYGYSRQEATGQPVEELIVPAEDRDAFITRLRRWLSSGQTPPAAEGTRLAKNGAVVPVLSSHVKLFNSKGQAELYNLDLDLTESKRLERQLLHAQKMESVGRLAGGIAHDFNNLITIILGNADLAVAMLPEDDPNVAYVKEIATAGEHAADLTRRLLAFSRRQVASPRVIDPNAALRDLESMLRRLVKEDVTIRPRLADDIWPVKIDPGQLEQILSNLVVNAVDAMPDGGTLTIETANQTIDQSFVDDHAGAQVGEFVRISVLDTGLGMEEKTLAKIFEPFFTTKERGKGTGLGLATCYGIVKQNRGYIWASSEPGMGTIFEIFLPRVDAAGVPIAEAKPAPAPAPLGGEETVLVVEDAHKVRSMMASALADKGYTVLAAEDGEDAIGKLDAEALTSLDLLITDVVMPRMNGKELSEHVQRRYPTCKVLFVSGYADDAIGQQGVLDPGVALLEKPFTTAALVARARQILDQ